MLTSISTSSALTNGAPTILQFPVGNQPLRSFLEKYDRSTPAGSSQSDPESATPDQRRFQARAAAWVRPSSAGRSDPKSSLTDIALKEIIAGKLTFEELKRHACRGVALLACGVRAAHGR